MEIKEFIANLKKSNFSLIIEDDKLLLKGNKKTIRKEEIQAIKKDEFVINYIKENKNQLIEYLSLLPQNFSSQKKSKNISSIYRLSSLQEGMLFHGLYNEVSGAYIEQFSCDIVDLDREILNKTWNYILKGHSILRSAFYYDDFSVPVQCVYREVKLPVEYFDYRDMSETQQVQAIKEYEEIDRNKGFDFKTVPLMRVGLLQLSKDRYRMFWTWHHILFDGWSMPILMEEFLTTYELLAAGKEVKEKEEDRYEDYIRYIERIDKEQEEIYWRNYMKGVEQSTLLPFINTTKERNKGVGIYKTLPLNVDAVTTAKIESYAQKHLITVNTLIQGIWSFLLHYYTGSGNIVYGVIVSGRPDDLPGVEHRVGMYINTLPLLAKVTQQQGIAKWLQDIQGEQASSRQYQHTPLQDIQRWTGIQGDLFDSLLVFENYPISKLLSSKQWSLKVENVHMHEQTNYPLNIIISVAEQVNIRFLYNSDLLEEPYIIKIHDHFEHVLLQIINTEKDKLSEIELLTQSEEHQLLVEFNDTAVDYPNDKTIIDLFEDQAAKTPEATGVVFEEGQLSYKQLNEKANQLAYYLRSKGVKEETLVPICIERSLEMIVGIIAILKAGGAYVPIDPEYPEERINYMLEDTSAAIVITSKKSKTKLHTVQGVELIELDTDWSTVIGHLPTVNCLLSTVNGKRLTTLAYVIYTSGSTGKPKGVRMTGGGLVNLLSWQEKQFENRSRRVLQFASLNFDVSFQEIFSTLCFGSALHLISEDNRRDTPKMIEDLAKHHITHLFIPYIVLKNLAEYILSLPHASFSLQEIIVAGEQLKLTEDIQAFVKKNNIRLINQYGPTEAHVVSSYSIEADAISSPLPPIGKPIDNTTLYILNDRQALVPAGVAGELYIGGVQVARGYLNQEDLTAQKFIKDIFSKEESGRLYRTGDLARWLADGNIEYLGRIDDQVKIRGYRVELGEIESVLQQHKGVRQGAVLARKDSSGSRQLVGYVAAEGKFNKEAIINDLKNKLPDYMVPALWVELESLPVTANGKINRKALPDPDASELLSNNYVAPGNEVEEKLAAIWQELLGVERVGIHDNFFDLGGNSLLAIRVISAVRRQMEFELGIKSLFLHPTIQELSVHLGGQSKDLLLPAITLEPRSEYIPLSFSQERLWFIDRLEGSVQYHLPVVLRLKGKLSKDALSHSLQSIVNRHEVLRTVIREQDGEAYQYINAPDKWKLSIFVGSKYQKDPEALQQYIQQLIKEPFDLSKDHMLRSSLVTLSDYENILVINMHHIASDGWSTSITVKEVIELYSAYTGDRQAHLAPLPIQYADYAIWQRNYLQGEVLDKKIEYWKDKLQGIAPLQLPTDFIRPAARSNNGAILNFDIEKDLSEKIQHLSHVQGTTLFMILLAAFKVLLHRCSGQQDICVGTAVAGRQQQEAEQLIGFFINSLALRSEVSGDASFIELLQQVKLTTLDAYEHQDIPFEKVVEVVVKERDFSRSPLFQVMLVLQNTPQVPELQVRELSLTVEDHERTISKLDITIFITETNNGLQGTVEYATDLYSEATIVRMLDHFKILLSSIIKAPQQKIGELAMLTKEEEHQLLIEFNDTAVDYPKDKTIVDLFEEQAAKTPGAIAVVLEEEQPSYQQLNERANQLAHYLRSRGVKEETLVPICIERSLEMIVGILGILKAGGAYVPIDPDYPQERISYMLEDTGAAIVVSSKESRSKLQTAEGVEVIEMDGDWSALNPQPSTLNPQPSIQPHHLAYVIYTSGSTGKPKGVMIEHRSAYSFISWCQQEFSDSHFEIAYASTSICFDLSVFEIFYPLNIGKPVRIIENGLHIGKYLSQDRFVLINSVPVVVGNLLKEGIDLSNVSVINMAGEPISLQVQQGLDATRIEVRNLYGPTEDTTYSTAFRLKNNEVVMIGTPISNTQIYIVNTGMQLVPLGVTGEICIGGAGLARGYLNRPGLTAEKFIADPFSKEEGARLYKTGDLGRWLADGNIEYLGRIDHQVKIRGYRIELGEIENALQQTEGVRQAVVLAKDDSNGSKKLVGYIVADEIITKEAIIAKLKTKLPEYMVPALWVELQSLPQTPNGKVDRKALPDPDASELLNNEYTAPRNEVEEKLAAIWQELLGVKKVGVNDNFFELGGHSLLAMKMVSYIERNLLLSIPINVLFQFTTISELSKYIATQTGAITQDKNTVAFELIDV